MAKGYVLTLTCLFKHHIYALIQSFACKVNSVYAVQCAKSVQQHDNLVIDIVKDVADFLCPLKFLGLVHGNYSSIERAQYF